MIRTIKKTISIIVIGIFLFNIFGAEFAQSYPQTKNTTLNPYLSMDTPTKRLEILATMWRESKFIKEAIILSEVKALQKYINALALLYPSGKYLMLRETIDDNFKLVRAVRHEDYEILMQKEEARAKETNNPQNTRYFRLMNRLLLFETTSEEIKRIREIYLDHLTSYRDARMRLLNS